MVEHTQTIRHLLPKNYLSMFDHSVVLALKELRKVVGYLFHYKTKNTTLIGPPAFKIGEDFNIMWKQQFFPDKIFYRFIIVSQSKLLTEGDISRELQNNSLGYFELIIFTLLHFVL